MIFPCPGPPPPHYPPPTWPQGDLPRPEADQVTFSKKALACSPCCLQDIDPRSQVAVLLEDLPRPPAHLPYSPALGYDDLATLLFPTTPHAVALPTTRPLIPELPLNLLPSPNPAGHHGFLGASFRRHRHSLLCMLSYLPIRSVHACTFGHCQFTRQGYVASPLMSRGCQRQGPAQHRPGSWPTKAKSQAAICGQDGQTQPCPQGAHLLLDTSPGSSAALSLPSGPDGCHWCRRFTRKQH